MNTNMPGVVVGTEKEKECFAPVGYSLNYVKGHVKTKNTLSHVARAVAW